MIEELQNLHARLLDENQDDVANLVAQAYALLLSRTDASAPEGD